MLLRTIMKKCRVTNTLAAMAAAVLMTGVCSCQQGTTEQENTMEPWQIQLEQSVSDNIYGEDLSLLGYQYLGQVNTPEQASQIYEEIFGRDSRMPAYRGSFTEFDMESWDEIRGHRCDNINVGFHERRVDSLLKTRPGLVEIEWSYKSRTFKTKALISSRTRRLDYDNVWSHIVVFRSSSKITRGLMPRTKSSEEYSVAYYDYKQESCIVSGNNILVKASVNVKLIGEYDNWSNRVSITNRTLESDTINCIGSGYTTVAGVRELDYQSGSDGWLHFAYGFGVAPESANLTLVFDDVTQRFNSIPSVYGDSGEKTFYAYQLKKEGEED